MMIKVCTYMGGFILLTLTPLIHISIPDIQAQTHATHKTLSPRQAKHITRSLHPRAEIIDIIRIGNTYRVRMIMPKGRIQDIYINAASGQVKNAPPPHRKAKRF